MSLEQQDSMLRRIADFVKEVNKININKLVKVDFLPVKENI
jgi:hypothetical protein